MLTSYLLFRTISGSCVLRDPSGSQDGEASHGQLERHSWSFRSAASVCAVIGPGDELQSEKMEWLGLLASPVLVSMRCMLHAKHLY